jgi:mono/diheme cytochrome c family protein
MRSARLFAAAIVGCFPASAGAADPRSGSIAGQQVYEKWCSSCHGPGTDSPGTRALAAKYNGQVPAQLERRRDLAPEVVKHFVRNGVSVMPSFRKTEITDQELEQLARYLSASK